SGLDANPRHPVATDGNLRESCHGREQRLVARQDAMAPCHADLRQMRNRTRMGTSVRAVVRAGAGNELSSLSRHPQHVIGGFVVADLPALPDFDSLWDFNAPDSTEAAFRAMLPGARS